MLDSFKISSYIWWIMNVLIAYSCLTLWTIAHQTPPVRGILQARILEWVAIPFSRGSSWPRDQTQVSHTGGKFFTIWVPDGCESWTIKKAEHWRTDAVVLEKILESSLDSKEIKSVNPKWNQLWIFIGRTDAEAEAPIVWSPDANSWLNGTDPDTRKDWGKEERG